VTLYRHCLKVTFQDCLVEECNSFLPLPLPQTSTQDCKNSPGKTDEQDSDKGQDKIFSDPTENLRKRKKRTPGSEKHSPPYTHTIKKKPKNKNTPETAT
jgi:hypothetical protein